MTTLAQLLAPFSDAQKVVVCRNDYSEINLLKNFAGHWDSSNYSVDHCYFNGAGELVIILAEGVQQ